MEKRYSYAIVNSQIPKGNQIAQLYHTALVAGKMFPEAAESYVVVLEGNVDEFT